MTEKMYYTGNNITIHNNPLIHAMALQDCLKAEKLSKTLERLFEIRIENLKKKAYNDTPQVVLDLAKEELIGSYKKFYLSDASDEYRFEAEIDNSLGLNFGVLLTASTLNECNSL
jgi:hypothetical protein